MAVTIPQYFTVHLGAPSTYAQNTTVRFTDYIKNVASSEIYPTWPETAIRANIYAQITFALNRYFTEFYPSRGYSFDITNSTSYDQYFVPGRNIFGTVSRIVDEIFDSFVQRQGTVGPIFAAYCNGTTSTCDGLSQWGTVTLANQGYTPYGMLQYYYGNDIDIVDDVPIAGNVPSYPGYSVSLGSRGDAVRQIQIRLNRISTDYPAIPKLYPVDGVFGANTESAVRAFQRIFNLTVDGIVGRSTWYKIIFVYNGVKGLSELDSEGITIEEYNQQYPDAVRIGNSGDSVRVLQYYLAVIAAYYPTVPPVEVTGSFELSTENAVKAIQQTFNLTPTGVVGDREWDQIQRIFLGIIDSQPQFAGGVAAYPGTPLRLGSSGDSVATLQRWLNSLSSAYPEIGTVAVTGLYGQQTQRAVRTLQELGGLPVTGIVGPPTWDSIAEIYSAYTVGGVKQSGQFPGYNLKEDYLEE